MTLRLTLLAGLFLLNWGAIEALLSDESWLQAVGGTVVAAEGLLILFLIVLALESRERQ